MHPYNWYRLLIVLCIVAALAASQGQWYRYPMTLRLIT